MSSSRWSRWLRNSFAASSLTTGTARLAARFRPGVEALEDRLVLTTWTVTSNGDDGSSGTLRWAIMQANGGTNDTVDFHIGSYGLAPSIILDVGLGALPTISSTMLIDGFSQGGPNGPGTWITIDGEYIPSANGLTVNADGATIQGLAIGAFKDGSGIELNGNADVVDGCYLGPIPIVGAGGELRVRHGQPIYGPWPPAGAAPLGGQANTNIIGVTIKKADAVVKNSTASGNTLDGISITGPAAQRAKITGNNIGANKTGLAPQGNGATGVEVSDDATDNTIGGTAAEANVISANGSHGVHLIRANANKILSNFIGLGKDGTTELGNKGSGVKVSEGASGNKIGDVQAGNIISKNLGDGVLLDGEVQLVTLNKIFGNFIGTTSPLGNVDKGNGANGVEIYGASGNMVGGANAGEGNVISANGGNGVRISVAAHGASAVLNVVAGNKIGTNLAGTAPLGNKWDGVYINNANFNFVGIPATTVSNIISGNRRVGVEIDTGNNNFVSNNYVGTNLGGSAPIANLLGGVSIRGLSNTIGGVTTASRNIISGNGTTGVGGTSDFGIYIGKVGGISQTTNNFIQGNYIGTDQSGMIAIGNKRDGVFVETGANGNTIGGDTVAAGNVISGNGTGTSGFGVSLYTSNNVVQNNKIGLAMDGIAILTNKGGWQDDQGSNNQWIDNLHD